MRDNKETNSSGASKTQIIAYWVATGIIVLQSVAGAVLDLTKNPSFVKLFGELGYPIYLLAILGIWRILAVVALITPRFPRVKEWAYAGLFFDFTGAAASHFFIDDVSGAIAPIIFTFILIASWYLRPTSRKL